MIKSVLGLFLASTLLGGCANTVRGGPPKMVQILENDRAGRLTQVAKAIEDDCFSLPVSGPAQPRMKRNLLADAYMLVVDEAYGEYEKNLLNESRSNNLASTIFSLGLSTAGTIAGESAAQTLSAIDTGVKGAEQSYDKEFLFNQTIPALLNQMRASRAEISNRIYHRFDADYDDWSSCHALRDLTAYEQAGTLVGALINLTANTGEDKNQKEKEAEETVTLKFDRGELASTLRMYFDPSSPAIASRIAALNASSLSRVGIAVPAGRLANTHIFLIISGSEGAAAQRKLAKLIVDTDPDTAATNNIAAKLNH